MTLRSPIYTRQYPADTQVRDWEFSSLPLPFNPAANVMGINQYSWPNPTLPNRLDATYVWFTLPRPIPSSNKPLSQYDWPLSTIPNRIDSTQVNTWLVLHNSVGVPFAQLSWPLPAQPDRIDATWVDAGNNFPPFALAATFPFNQYYWPNPTQSSPINANWLGGFPPVAPPLLVAPADWPLSDPAYRYNTNQVSYLLPLLTGAPVPRPYNQYDWPLPTQPNRIDQTWIQGISGPARAAPVGVFSTSTWKWTFRDDVGSVSSLSSALTFVQPPFNQLDWPLPKAYPIPDSVWISTNPNLQRPTITILPFNQYSWPLPVIAKPIDGSWIIEVPLLTPVVPIIVQGFAGKWRWKEGYNQLIEKRVVQPAEDIKKAAAVLSKMGGHARAQSLSSKQRSNIASTAAQARWNPKKR